MIKDLSDNHLFNNYPCEAEDAKIESLRQQLAAALAACKAKDEAILHMCNNVIADDNYDGNLVQKALDIQPDDSALKAWLGEPVAWMNPYGGVIQNPYTGLEKEKFNIPLYAPKGMK